MQIENGQKSKRKRKHESKLKEKCEEPTDSSNVQQPNTASVTKKNKKRKLIKQPDLIKASNPDVNTDEQTETLGEVSSGRKKESNRQKKRKKYIQQITERKLKQDVASQQKALNYLSQWKHNRDGWKFEKLRQVWLQQNLFSSLTIPQKYWKSTLEYFAKSKGQSKQTLITEAMKIIEGAEKDDEKEGEDEAEKETSEEEVTKLNRARELIQYLQE